MLALRAHLIVKHLKRCNIFKNKINRNICRKTLALQLFKAKMQ